MHSESPAIQQNFHNTILFLETIPFNILPKKNLFYVRSYMGYCVALVANPVYNIVKSPPYHIKYTGW
jgi:hypothetical protein